MNSQGWRERGGGRLAPSLGEVSSPDLGVELGEAESDPFSRCFSRFTQLLTSFLLCSLERRGQGGVLDRMVVENRHLRRDKEVIFLVKLILPPSIFAGADPEAWQEQGSSAGDSPKVEQEQPAEGWPGRGSSLTSSSSLYLLSSVVCLLLFLHLSSSLTSSSSSSLFLFLSSVVCLLLLVFVQSSFFSWYSSQ